MTELLYVLGLFAMFAVGHFRGRRMGLKESRTVLTTPQWTLIVRNLDSIERMIVAAKLDPRLDPRDGPPSDDLDPLNTAHRLVVNWRRSLVYRPLVDHDEIPDRCFETVEPSVINGDQVPLLMFKTVPTREQMDAFDSASVLAELKAARTAGLVATEILWFPRSRMSPRVD